MVLFSTSAIGFKAGEQKKQRVKQLKELMIHMKVLYGEIEYGRTALPEVMDIVAARNKGDITSFFSAVSEELSGMTGEPFSMIWNRCMKTELSATSLNRKDKILLEGLGENLGFLDQKMQLTTIGHYMINLEEAMKEATEEVKEKVRLYQTLGILFGIFVVIVMI